MRTQCVYVFKLFCVVFPILLHYSMAENETNLEKRKKSRAEVFSKCILPPDYNPHMRPQITAKMLDINVSFFIQDINRNSDLMHITVSLLLHQQWTDLRLDYGSKNCTSDSGDFVLPKPLFRSIWLPDTRLNLNEHQLADWYLQIESNGQVHYLATITAIARCTTDFTYFPADQQNCTLTLESDTDDSLQYKWKFPFNDNDSVGLVWPKEQILLPALHYRGFSLRSGRNSLYPQLSVDFFVDRSFSFYLARFYLPAAALVIISFLPLFLPPASHPKVCIGVMVILTMVTLVGASHTAGELPKIAYLTSLDVYLFASFFAAFFAVVQYAVVGYFELMAEEGIYDLIKIGSNQKKENDDDPQKKYQKEVTLKRAIAIDAASRKLFPLTFAVFNVIYATVVIVALVKNNSVNIQFPHYH